MRQRDCLLRETIRIKEFYIPHIPLQSSNHSGCMFKLLVRAAEPRHSDARTIEFGGIQWTLAEFDKDPGTAEVPEYVCISYSWGSGRTANPLEVGQSISDRAIPAIDATIKALQPGAIWIDSLCVPSLDPARATCLQHMGMIFGTATQVTAVLSKSCAAILKQIHDTACMDLDALSVLESDDWVTRAWTYQEIANSKIINFLTEGGSGIAIGGQQLLNSLGDAISDYKKTKAIDASEFRRRYPRVDGLEDLLADYMISDYLQRSAYQAMAAMDHRYSERAEDSFNAMIGAITSTPADISNDLQLPPAERFMQACEAKGDYSFIYCAAPRNVIPGRRWRPTAGRLAAVLSWHTFGVGQSGTQCSTHLQLDNMCRMTPGAVNADGRNLVNWWLQSADNGASSSDLANAVLERLRRSGFSGSGTFIEMDNGYFFPQSTIANAKQFDVVVSAGLRWVHGGPGLLVTRDEMGTHQFVDAGVFVGRVPKSGEPIDIA